MKPEIIQQLLDLNQRFYADYGPAFAATRRRLQPGVVRAAEVLAGAQTWLDLGCGSGELARGLARTGFVGTYLGLDSSAQLLEEARQNAPAWAAYHLADLASPAWDAGLEPGVWEAVTCFAVLHHLPGRAARLDLLHKAHRLLAVGGRLVFSVWQFQHSPRLMERRQPWEQVGLTEGDLEIGDTLLDWRYTLPGQPEQAGLRYVHLFSREELAELADASRFKLTAEYESDGAGGRLGLYQVWQGI